MPNKQFARGIFAEFGSAENPFQGPNGMEENLRVIDDHLAGFTLGEPVPVGTPLPPVATDGEWVLIEDGSYATYNGGAWREYPPQLGARVTLQQLDSVDVYVCTGAGWQRIAESFEQAVAELEGDVQGLRNGYFTQTPFGRSGMRIITGAKYDAHYGWGGIVVFPSGKWMEVYRKATHHGVRDYSELRARDSYNGGASWLNDRLVLSTGPYDLRPDPPRMLAAGRAGFLVNRQSEGVDHYSPWFVYTDDEGETFSFTEILTDAPYTFSGTQALIDWPASQGGHDQLGFAAYGYLSAGGVDMLATSDNGESWQMYHEVAVPFGDVASLSETAIVRLGTSDRWIMFSRARSVAAGGGWRKTLTVFTTTNLRNWGLPGEAGLAFDGSPPGAIYDPDTNIVHLLNVARGNRPLDGFEQHLMHAAADADALWSAGGSFSALGVGYFPMTPIPHWATGYLAPFRHDGKWYATMTCGEPGLAGGAKGVQLMIGDFEATGTDIATLVGFFLKRQKAVALQEIVADDNLHTTFPRITKNASGTAIVSSGPYGTTFSLGGAVYTVLSDGLHKIDVPMLLNGLADPIPGATSKIQISVGGASSSAIATYAGSASLRKHWAGYNPQGEGGSITTQNNSASFNTTSDENFKIFLREFPGSEAIDVILADPVREFDWVPERGGGRAVGWGAQTSYAVRPDLATPGGWFDDEGNPAQPDTPGASYQPWGIDQSKRTPYLWAATAWLIASVRNLVQQLAQMHDRVVALEDQLEMVIARGQALEQQNGVDPE